MSKLDESIIKSKKYKIEIPFFWTLQHFNYFFRTVQPTYQFLFLEQNNSFICPPINSYFQDGQFLYCSPINSYIQDSVSYQFLFLEQSNKQIPIFRTCNRHINSKFLDSPTNISISIFRIVQHTNSYFQDLQQTYQFLFLGQGNQHFNSYFQDSPTDQFLFLGLAINSYFQDSATYKFLFLGNTNRPIPIFRTVQPTYQFLFLGILFLGQCNIQNSYF